MSSCTGQADNEYISPRDDARRRLGRILEVVTALLKLITFIVVVHIILGTCWFSGFLFLGPGDAITIIILRFLSLNIVCRLMIVAELVAM